MAEILPFLNDNQANIKYLTGIEPFFTVRRGWMICPLRHDYAENRLKVMISSGIYAHWDTWFRLAKPRTLLFHHYANWTYPRYNVVSQLTYNSKVVTGFYACGICFVFCLICLMYEISYAWIGKRLNLYKGIKLTRKLSAYIVNIAQLRLCTVRSLKCVPVNSHLEQIWGFKFIKCCKYLHT